MASEIDELRRDTSELTTALRRLSESTTSAAKTFGEFGSATGKVGRAWTIMSRITSGSGFWQIQNRIRSVSNIFELFTKAQEASFDAQIKALDAGEGLRDSLDAINDALAGPIENTKRYQNLLLSLGDAEIAEAQARKEYEGIQRKLTNQIMKQDKALRRKFGIDKSSLELMKDRIKQEGVLAEITRPAKKVAGRIQDTLFGKRGTKPIDFDKDPFGQRSADRRRGLIAQAGRGARNYAEFSMKVMQGAVKFIGLGTLFFAKFLVLGTLLSLVLGLLFFFIRQAWPTFKTFLDGAFDAFKLAFTSIYKLVLGVFGFFKAIFEGRFFDALKILFKDIFLNLIKAIAGILGGIATTLVGLAMSVVIGLGKTILKGIKALARKLNPLNYIRGRQSGGIVSEGMTLVGEGGPELVRLPMGSRVFTNAESRRMSGTTNITVQVTGRVGASDMEIKDIAQKVSREIGLQMNRTGSTAVRF